MTTQGTSHESSPEPQQELLKQASQPIDIPEIKPQKSRKRFEILITPSTSSVSAAPQETPEILSSQDLPNIETLPFIMKASIYELKELAIRIISLLKIETNLNFYEKQKLSQLILNFKDSFCLKYESYVNDQKTMSRSSSSHENNTSNGTNSNPGSSGSSCSSTHCLLFFHYFLGLLQSLQSLAGLSSIDLLTNAGSEKKIDDLNSKILKRILRTQETGDSVSLAASPSSSSSSSSSTIALQIVLKQFPEELFPKTKFLLSEAGQQEFLLHLQKNRPHRSTQSSNSTNEESSPLSSPAPSRNISSRLSRSFSRLSSLFGRSSSKIHTTTAEESVND
jgi:hypothetical protein